MEFWDRVENLIKLMKENIRKWRIHGQHTETERVNDYEWV